MIIVAGLVGLVSDASAQSFLSNTAESILENPIDLKLNSSVSLLHTPMPLLNKSCNSPYKVYAKNHLGIFCIAEEKLQSASKIPFRFRLGSVDYVNWLESKPHSSAFFIQN
ncbi:MAG: hypothetical protein HKO89_06090 [Saprospiraceae bacterium]|nr:hypothetical protein [Saprospiraceae bacterium]